MSSQASIDPHEPVDKSRRTRYLLFQEQIAQAALDKPAPLSTQDQRSIALAKAVFTAHREQRASCLDPEACKRILELTIQSSNLNKGLRTAPTELIEVRGQYENTLDQADDMSAKLDTTRIERDQCNEKIQELHRKLDDHTEVNNLNKRIDELEQKVRDLQHQIQSKDTEVDDLHIFLGSVKADNQSTTANLSWDIGFLKAQLKTQESNVLAKTNEVARLEKLLQDQTKHLEITRNEKGLLVQYDDDAFQRDVNEKDLQAEIQLKTEENDGLEMELSAVRNDLAELQVSHQELGKQTQLLQVDSNELGKACDLIEKVLKHSQKLQTEVNEHVTSRRELFRELEEAHELLEQYSSL